VLITLDSRAASISKKSKLTIKKEKFKAQLVKIKGYNNFDTLRQKLNWGLDARN
jgi:NAD+ kinase